MSFKTFRPSSCIKIISTALTILALGVSAYAGTFTDRDGAVHQWSIDSTHALVWEGSSYIPFGTVFDPRYLSSGQTDENWASDEAYIKSLKSAGISDVIVRLGNGVASSPSIAFQRTIDLLEANGLNYGIVLNDPPYVPLTGYVIQPAVNRVEGLGDSSDVTRSFPDAKSVIWAIVGARSGDIKSLGQTATVDGQVTVKISSKDNDPCVLLLYPQKTVAATGAVGLPDLWSDFDRHRDNLVAYLMKARFGKGLRFFADPFAESFGMRGEVDDMIPTSAAFCNEYAYWLSKKYSSTRDLDVSWGMLQHTPSDFQEAARLIPLWTNGRGISAVYDDNMNKRYAVDSGKSKIWLDFHEFQTQSIKAYMNAMADVIKRTAADVPIVYTSNGLQRFYKADNASGFDALSISAIRTKSLTEDAGRVLSLADNSTKNVWIVGRMSASDPAYRNRADFFGNLNTMRNMGAKAFFVEAEPGDSNSVNWLSEYAGVSRNDKLFSGYRPSAVYYPEGAEHTSIKRLSNGAWWLPALTSGSNIRMGAAFAGYTILDPDGRALNSYIWSLHGKQTIHLGATSDVLFTDADGNVTTYKSNNGRVEAIVDEDPSMVSELSPEQLVPLESVDEAIVRLKTLMLAADKKKMSTGEYNINMVQAAGMVASNKFSVALDMVQTSIDELTQRMKGLESEALVNSSETGAAKNK